MGQLKESCEMKVKTIGSEEARGDQQRLGGSYSFSARLTITRAGLLPFPIHITTHGSYIQEIRSDLKIN